MVETDRPETTLIVCRASDENGALNVSGPEGPSMQCHYCDRDADVAVEKDGVTVGLCEDDFREQMTELADGEWLETVEDDLNVEGIE